MSFNTLYNPSVISIEKGTIQSEHEFSLSLEVTFNTNVLFILFFLYYVQNLQLSDFLPSMLVNRNVWLREC